MPPPTSCYRPPIESDNNPPLLGDLPLCCQTYVIERQTIDPSITQASSQVGAYVGVPAQAGTYLNNPVQAVNFNANQGSGYNAYNLVPYPQAPVQQIQNRIIPSNGPWRNYQIAENVQPVPVPCPCNVHNSYPATQNFKPNLNISASQSPQQILDLRGAAQIRRRAPQYLNVPQAMRFREREDIEESTLWGQNWISSEFVNSDPWSGQVRTGSPNANNYMQPYPKNVKVQPRTAKSYIYPSQPQYINGPHLTMYPQNQIMGAYESSPHLGMKNMEHWRNGPVPQINTPVSSRLSPRTTYVSPQKTYSPYEEQQPIYDLSRVSQYQRMAPTYYSTPQTLTYPNMIEGNTNYGKDFERQGVVAKQQQFGSTYNPPSHLNSCPCKAIRNFPTSGNETYLRPSTLKTANTKAMFIRPSSNMLQNVTRSSPYASGAENENFIQQSNVPSTSNVPFTSPKNIPNVTFNLPVSASEMYSAQSYSEIGSASDLGTPNPNNHSPDLRPWQDFDIPTNIKKIDTAIAIKPFPKTKVPRPSRNYLTYKDDDNLSSKEKQRSRTYRTSSSSEFVSEGFDKSTFMVQSHKPDDYELTTQLMSFRGMRPRETKSFPLVSTEGQIGGMVNTDLNITGYIAMDETSESLTSIQRTQSANARLGGTCPCSQ